MRRIQGSITGARDPDEEKRKIREGVISNFVIFGAICVLIRTAPFFVQHAYK